MAKPAMQASSSVSCSILVIMDAPKVSPGKFHNAELVSRFRCG